jgi:hypothetical protein
MTDVRGPAFQVAIVGPSLGPTELTVDEAQFILEQGEVVQPIGNFAPHIDIKGVTGAAFTSFGYSRPSGAVIDRIDDLEGIWDQVIAKLSHLAAKSQITAAASDFELSEIEFHVGIEAGLSVGLVTKGDASVSIKFSSKKKADQPA